MSAFVTREKYSRRHVAASAARAALVAGHDLAIGRESGPSYPGRLCYRDLERFRLAQARMKRGAAAVAAMEWYVNGGTEGLKAYVKTYDVTPLDLANSLVRHPKSYASLSDVRHRIAPHEAEIARAARHLRLLVPVPDVPIYFFVGAMGHGATVKEVDAARGEQGLGVLVPIENLAMSLDDLPQLTTHELAHVAQVQCQGLDRYRVLYRERSRGNHLAYAIREGGADFLSQLASGSLRARHRYLEEHEAQLWREFSKLLYEPAGASAGWFSGLSAQHPQRPPSSATRLDGRSAGASICTQPTRSWRCAKYCARTLLRTSNGSQSSIDKTSLDGSAMRSVLPGPAAAIARSR
jgi:hypothetical protein